MAGAGIREAFTRGTHVLPLVRAPGCAFLCLLSRVCSIDRGSWLTHPSHCLGLLAGINLGEGRVRGAVFLSDLNKNWN